VVLSRLIFFLLFAALLAIRAYFSWKAHEAGLSPTFEDEGKPVQQGGGARLLGVIIPLLLLALLVLYAVSPAGLSWLSAPLPGWLRWLGAALGALSLPLQIWTHITLQNQWSAAARSGKGHILITQGPFRRVRHPLYASLILFFVGLSLVSAFWPFLVLAFAAIPLLHGAAIKEEAVMRQRFHREYDEYAERTGRYLPRLRRGGG
jgi:protein-S-isoprenylcysteine O-methyltransferase Ste14